MGRFSWRKCPKGIRIERGFSLVEVLIVIVFIGILVALAGPAAAKLIRRSEDMAALATARQVLAVARLEAVKTGANLVVVFSKDSDNTIRLKTFRDKASLTTVSGDDGNGAQDAGEPTLGDVTLSGRIHFWKQGQSKDDVTTAILLDTYGGDASLTDRIIFLPTGGISPPQDSASGPPLAISGRGIYFADWQGKNYFRVTVESDLSGKARVDKWVNEAVPPGYYPPGPTAKWRWL